MCTASEAHTALLDTSGTSAQEDAWRGWTVAKLQRPTGLRSQRAINAFLEDKETTENQAGE